MCTCKHTHYHRGSRNRGIQLRSTSVIAETYPDGQYLDQIEPYQRSTQTKTFVSITSSILLLLVLQIEYLWLTKKKRVVMDEISLR